MSEAAHAGEHSDPSANGPRGGALRVLATSFGIVAGLLGLEHGYFEWQQGNAMPAGLVINAIGPPCQPPGAWHACEPAFTVIPDFRVTGSLAMVVAILLLVWAAVFVQRRHGGAVLLLMIGALWLVGGGFVTLIVGLVAGLAGTAIGSSLAWWRGHLAPAGRHVLAAAWPWVLLTWLAWEGVSWVVGSLANDVMLGITPALTALSLPVLVLIVLAAVAHDIEATTPGPEPDPLSTTSSKVVR